MKYLQVCISHFRVYLSRPRCWKALTASTRALSFFLWSVFRQSHLHLLLHQIGCALVDVPLSVCVSAVWWSSPVSPPHSPELMAVIRGTGSYETMSFFTPNSTNHCLYWKTLWVSLWLDARLLAKGLLFVRWNWICGQAVSEASNNKKECDNRRDCRVRQVI